MPLDIVKENALSLERGNLPYDGIVVVVHRLDKDIAIIPGLAVCPGDLSSDVGGNPLLIDLRYIVSY